MNVAFNWQEGSSGAALRSWRETGPYEGRIRVGTTHPAKPADRRGCRARAAVPTQRRGCATRAQVVSLREAEPEAAGEPGDRPASDSASPDPCPGYSWFGVCLRQAAQARTPPVARQRMCQRRDWSLAHAMSCSSAVPSSRRIAFLQV